MIMTKLIIDVFSLSFFSAAAHSEDGTTASSFRRRNFQHRAVGVWCPVCVAAAENNAPHVVEKVGGPYSSDGSLVPVHHQQVLLTTFWFL